MRRRSIGQKIFLLVLPICLIPPVIFLALLGWGARLTFERTIGSELGARAGDMADRFDQFLIAKTHHLHQLVGLPGADLGNLLAETPERAPIKAVVHMNAQGRFQVLGAAPEAALFMEHWISRDPAARRWAGKVALISENGIFTDLTLAVPTQPSPAQFALFAYPDHKGGLLFLVHGTRDLIREFLHGLPRVPESFLVYSARNAIVYPESADRPHLAERIGEFLRRQTTLPGWFTVDEANGSYLVAPAPSQIMKHMPGAGRNDSFATVWFMILPYDMETFLGPLASLVWLSIIIALLLVLVLLGLAYLEARHIVSPLLVLRRQAEAFSQGDLDVRASIRSRDEIGDLAEAFNAMAQRLRTTYRTLEDRLADNQLRTRHINAINEITAAIIQVLSLDSIFEILSRELVKLLPFDALWIALYEQDGGDLRVSHITPQGLVSILDGGRLPLATSLHGLVIKQRETLHAEIGPLHPSEFHEMHIFSTEGFQSYLIAPLPARNRIIGTLTVASRAPDAFNNRLAPIMTSLAGAVAVAIEQAELFQRLSHFARQLEQKVADRNHELELAHQKLILTEKYFATGRMAGNLAHEINNPLGIIKNYLQLTRNNLTEAGGGCRQTDPNLQHIEIINEEVDRIARLVHQLLNLHRPVEQQVEPVDVNQLLDNILAIMSEQLESGQIRVARELAPDLPRPIASPDLIRQVLLNLVRNAQDAMEGGGLLTVRTSALIAWEDGAESQVIRIRVSDTGLGIAPEHLSQIFDPFFTTKSPDKGTGLGLCVSYSVVSMYHGSIDVESTPGRGTAFIVTLPIEIPEDEDEAEILAPTADRL